MEKEGPYWMKRTLTENNLNERLTQRKKNVTKDEHTGRGLCSK